MPHPTPPSRLPPTILFAIAAHALALASSRPALAAPGLPAAAPQSTPAAPPAEPPR
jgi:hypothetical protein